MTNSPKVLFTVLKRFKAFYMRPYRAGHDLAWRHTRQPLQWFMLPEALVTLCLQWCMLPEMSVTLCSQWFMLSEMFVTLLCWGISNIEIAQTQFSGWTKYLNTTSRLRYVTCVKIPWIVLVRLCCTRFCEYWKNPVVLGAPDIYGCYLLSQTWNHWLSHRL
jgi:hypothetical protein